MMLDPTTFVRQWGVIWPGRLSHRDVRGTMTQMAKRAGRSSTPTPDAFAQGFRRLAEPTEGCAWIRDPDGGGMIPVELDAGPAAAADDDDDADDPQHATGD